MKWLIWSNEHQMWWLPASSGYTKHKEEAGQYEFDEALKIVEDANRYQEFDAVPNESMTPAISSLQYSK